MSTLLNGHPIIEQAYGKYQEFNHDERLRALDEAHKRFLHDLATDIEAAHEKGKDEGKAEGREEGREEERNNWTADKIETLLRILTKRFGDVPPPVRDKLYTIHNLDLLGEITDVALDCRSLDEFEQALGK